MRPRKSQTLDIYFRDRLVGELTKSYSGAITFTYGTEWIKNGFAISQSLPLSEKTHSGDKPRIYFENLLPDLNEVRDLIAQKLKAQSSDAFDILSVIGNDCVGALRFESHGKKVEYSNKIKSRKLTKRELNNIINNLKKFPLGMNDDVEDFRISLAGAQDKTALLRLKTNWHLPIGTTPTTHIIKPAMTYKTDLIDMSSSVHNEYFCMKLAKSFGLKVADVFLLNTDNQIVLVVERFDRVLKNNQIIRVPQEDFCQVLSRSSTLKYEKEGGPGMSDISHVLNLGQNAFEDKKEFCKAIVFFYLIGAIDGHAKNFSIQYGVNGFRLCPLYDILSVFPALDQKRAKALKYKYAMSIGNNRHYQAHRISRRHFIESAKDFGLKSNVVEECIDEILSCFSKKCWESIKLSPLCDKKTVEKIVNGMSATVKRLK